MDMATALAELGSTEASIDAETRDRPRPRAALLLRPPARFILDV
jgi:hypothetical protein